MDGKRKPKPSRRWVLRHTYCSCNLEESKPLFSIVLLLYWIGSSGMSQLKAYSILHSQEWSNLFWSHDFYNYWIFHGLKMIYILPLIWYSKNFREMKTFIAKHHMVWKSLFWNISELFIRYENNILEEIIYFWLSFLEIQAKIFFW